MNRQHLTDERRPNDGQRVTLLVGLGLELATGHRKGHCHGPLHPAHYLIDSRGRPRLRPMPANAGVSVADDVMALVRLGLAISPAEGAIAKGCQELLHSGLADPEVLDLQALVLWLLSVAPAQPLGRPRWSGR